MTKWISTKVKLAPLHTTILVYANPISSWKDIDENDYERNLVYLREGNMAWYEESEVEVKNIKYWLKIPKGPWTNDQRT